MLIRYHAGERRVWSVLRVPTAEQEAARRVHRELERLGHERTAHINRIRAGCASSAVGLSRTAIASKFIARSSPRRRMPAAGVNRRSHC
jgi:transposase